MRLDSSARALVFATILLMGLVRTALRVAPFRIVKRVAEAGPLTGTRFGKFSEEQVAWAVLLASRYIPKATCLTQALTARLLLTFCGHMNQLHIGVTRDSDFKAHAWIECRRGVLVGGTAGSERFTPILSFRSARSGIED